MVKCKQKAALVESLESLAFLSGMMRKILPQNKILHISGKLFKLIKIKAKISIKRYIFRSKMWLI